MVLFFSVEKYILYGIICKKNRGYENEKRKTIYNNTSL